MGNPCQFSPSLTNILFCILSLGHVHKKMKMLENNQQGTDSHTALVELSVNVVEDRVNVVEDSVHHLQGDLSIF